jgi:hypothetical protein
MGWVGRSWRSRGRVGRGYRGRQGRRTRRQAQGGSVAIRSPRRSTPKRAHLGRRRSPSAFATMLSYLRVVCT